MCAQFDFRGEKPDAGARTKAWARGASRWSRNGHGYRDAVPHVAYEPSEFMKLTKLEPHQKLRAENRIVQWDASMKHVFFLSHQWTSFAHPDQTGEQLRAMHRIILRMISGKLPRTSPAFTDAAYLPASLKVTPKEWATMVQDAYIWVECVVPQNPVDRTAP
jgi:hypothetical protein